LSGIRAATKTYLDEIVAHKRSHPSPLLPDLEARIAAAPMVRLLHWFVGSYRTILIAECKRASPSAGLISARYDPAATARVYEASGASAISVLTDERFFQGSLHDLDAVRAVVNIPVLRKDFTLTEIDILEARAHGADLVLLIARVLSEAELAHLLATSRSLGMQSIVEVHDEDDLQRSLAVGAQLVGINNRDLSTFETSLATSERLLPLLPDDAMGISESGITSGEQVARLRKLGAQGVLVGEAIMRAENPGALTEELVDAGCPDCWRSRNRE
jgi:indole-3-glycerol phosphate synthase